MAAAEAARVIELAITVVRAAVEGLIAQLPRQLVFLGKAITAVPQQVMQAVVAVAVQVLAVMLQELLAVLVVLLVAITMMV